MRSLSGTRGKLQLAGFMRVHAGRQLNRFLSSAISSSLAVAPPLPTRITLARPPSPPQVPWPLSIAASEAALAQYQMVFRHIFELKWVERELSR